MVWLQVTIFELMKKNTGKYQEIKILPEYAMTVKDYAESKNISTAYVYKQIKNGSAKFKIVVFKTINFIIP